VLGAGSIAAFMARRPLWQRVQRYVMGSVLATMALTLGLDRSRAVATVGP
jgi:threonine/homoserine/homoserine lactone efflux protein